MRKMYVHSYQSYIWNSMATLRLEKYGKENAVVGDLVYTDTTTDLVDDDDVEAEGDAETEEVTQTKGMVSEYVRYIMFLSPPPYMRYLFQTQLLVGVGGKQRFSNLFWFFF